MLSVKIIRALNDIDGCLLGNDIYNQLEIQKDKRYFLNIGQFKVICNIKCKVNEDKCIYFPDEIMKKMLLYDDIVLNIWRKNENIYLGPVVGMLLRRKYCENVAEGNPQLETIEHIKEAATYEKCMAYCFSVENVDWNNNTIKGYTFNSILNRWQYRWLPMPDVIYDRLGYVSKDKKQEVTQCREELEENPNISFINPIGSLGKWVVHQKLFLYPEMRKYLPETILYRRIDDILLMLKKHRFIFIKSCYGSRGQEVFSVEMIGQEYKIDFYDKKLKQIIIGDIEEVKKLVEKFILEKQQQGRRTFIIQKGINLIKYKGHKMDFRITLEKNEEGEWEAINYYATHSKKDSNITNYCVGGVAHLYENVYATLKRDYKNIPTQEEFGKATIEIAKYIEKSFGTYGEIGMDMAIDTEGNIWFIEGNSKPDKYRDPSIDNMEGPSPQSCAIFKYSKYLAQLRK